MPLAVKPPLEPMLAKSVAKIPPGMAYEPKFDGFRCLVFRNQDEVTLLSRNGRDLSQYFPELVEALLENTPFRCVLDGEIVIIDGDRLNFTALSERIHPAASRIAKLAVATPSSFVAWDVLALDSDDLMGRPLTERREALERALATADDPVYLAPLTLDIDVAQRWFTEFEGAGLDGVMAKPLTGTYEPGKRTMFKIKHEREADVVIAGYRLHKTSTPERPLLGSLQLALWDGDALQWVGAATAFKEQVRADLITELAPLVCEPGTPEYDAHPWARPESTGSRAPGGISRWSGVLKEYTLLRPEIVATVAYEHMEGLRFRHNARFLRWRPDRDARSCGFDQLEEVVDFDVREVLAR